MIEAPPAWELLAKASVENAPAKPRCNPCARGERQCQCDRPAPTAEQVRAAAMPDEEEWV